MRGLLIGLCVLGFSSAVWADASPRGGTTAAVGAWAKQNAVPFTNDLSPIKAVVGDARVLALGEGTHNAHELWSIRNRLFAYAVEELGFTAIAAETGYAQAIATDDYARGHDVPAVAAARGVFSWSDQAFEENFELIEWMRAYNARPTTKRKIRFYGLEMAGTLQPDGRPLIEPALAYIASLDAGRARHFEQRFAPLLSQFNSEQWSKLESLRQEAILAAVQDLVSAFERWQIMWIGRTSSHDFQRAYRFAIIARQLVSNFRMDGDGRDIAAAENLRWVIEREGRRGRVLVFAHNSHVAKWREPPDDDERVHSAMGEFAHDLLGDDLAVIGTLYDRGETRDWIGLFGFTNDIRPVPPSIPSSLNGVMAQVGSARFVLDLRKLPQSGPVAQWFAEPQPVRNINIRDEYQGKLKPAVAFDALLFIRDITPLEPRR